MTKKDFRFVTSTMVTAVEPHNGKLALRVRQYAQEEMLNGFDTVVMAVGVVPDNSLGLALKQRLENVHLIGDCEAPGDYRKAVHDAAGVAIEL